MRTANCVLSAHFTVRLVLLDFQILYSWCKFVLQRGIEMAKNRTKEELQRLHDYAKILITQNKLNQTEASKKTGISKVTMNKWYNEGNWGKLQQNFFLTRKERMADLLDELTEFQESIKNKDAGKRFADSKEADVRSKLIKGIKDLETNASLPEIINSCEGLLEFIRKIDLEKAQELVGYVDAFIKSKL